MKCPHCNKSTSDLGKKCVHCGKDLQESIGRDNDFPVKCPLCSLNTEIIDLAGVELDYCYSCGGIWFDKGEIIHFQDALTYQNLCRDMTKTLKEMSLTNRNTKRVDYLNCPVCSQLMSHKNFVELSNIIIDRCADHGTWAEQDDLIKILEIVGSGKIEKLIAMAENHKQEKLDQRLKEIEAKQSYLNTELSRVNKFSKVHFILDFFGFTYKRRLTMSLEQTAYR